MDNDNTFEVDRLYCDVSGRNYPLWCTSRDNGTAFNDLIENPAYIIESLIRDEIFVERDLIIEEASSGTTFICNALSSAESDYYNGATFHNVTQNYICVISDYDAGTKTITLDTPFSPPGTGDKFFISNIQGDNKIIAASFDAVGNTTNGTRDGWKMSKAIYERVNSQELISSVLEQSFLALIVSNNKYKLCTLGKDAGTSAVLSNPIKQGGQYLFSSSMSDPSEICTDYQFNYAYNYGRDAFRLSLTCSASAGTPELEDYRAKCETAKNNYKKIKRAEVNLDWVYDWGTALNFAKLYIDFHTSQRQIINYSGDIAGHIQYEVGDQVKIDLPRLMPSSKNNSAIYIIKSKSFQARKGDPYIDFILEELP